MRNISLIFIIITLFFSCKNENVNSEIPVFCDNELNLLSSFDTLNKVSHKIFEIQDSAIQRIPKSFDYDICCQDLRFNTVFNYASDKTISLTLNCYYPCDDCPLFVRERNYCTILLNAQGQIMFEGEIVPLDSIGNKVTFLYNQIGKRLDLPDNKRNFYILINWDKEVETLIFQKFIREIINGYLNHVEIISQLEYKKELCSLDMLELKEISEKVPFNLRIDIREVIIEYDFDTEKNN